MSGKYKKCPYCGANIPFLSKVCQYCGKELEGVIITKADLARRIQDNIEDLEKIQPAGFVPLFLKYFRITGTLVFLIAFVYLVSSSHGMSFFNIFMMPFFIFLSLIVVPLTKRSKKFPASFNIELENLAAVNKEYSNLADLFFKDDSGLKDLLKEFDLKYKKAKEKLKSLKTSVIVVNVLAFAVLNYYVFDKKEAKNEYVYLYPVRVIIDSNLQQFRFSARNIQMQKTTTYKDDTVYKYEIQTRLEGNLTTVKGFALYFADLNGDTAEIFFPSKNTDYKFGNFEELNVNFVYETKDVSVKRQLDSITKLPVWVIK